MFDTKKYCPCFRRFSLMLLFPAAILSFQTATAQTDKPLVAIEASKMNVFYIGVDNPLRVAAAGVPAGELDVALVGAGTITGSDGKYNVVVKQPGEVTIRVSRKTGDALKMLSEQKYRVKRIPDPMPFLNGKYRSGSIDKEALQSAQGLAALMENFDFDAYCEVVGYEITVLKKKQEPVVFDCKGAKIPPEVTEAFKKLEGDGDAVFIDNIRIKCPGDAAARHIDGMVFKL